MKKLIERIKRGYEALKADLPDGKHYPIFVSREEMNSLHRILAGEERPPQPGDPTRMLMWRVDRLCDDALSHVLQSPVPIGELGWYTVSFREDCRFNIEVRAINERDAIRQAEIALATAPSRRGAHRVVYRTKPEVISRPLTG